MSWWNSEKNIPEMWGEMQMKNTKKGKAGLGPWAHCGGQMVVRVGW